MAIGGWVLAALAAGAIGWIGQPIMMLLPESADANPGAPRYRDIARSDNVAWWLAGAAALAAVVGAVVVPMFLMPAWLVMCGIGAWLAVIDWHTRLLPTTIVHALGVATSVLVALEAWIASDWTILWRGLVAGSGAFLIFYVLWWVSDRRRPGSFGYGDVRLAAPLGLTLGSIGVEAACIGLYTAFVLGAVAGLVRRGRGEREGFAFGPWMVAGAALGPAISAVVT